MKRATLLVIAVALLAAAWLIFSPERDEPITAELPSELEESRSFERHWPASREFGRWPVGHRVAYRLDASHVLTIKQPDGSQRDVSTSFDARWESVVLEVANERVILGHQLEFERFESGAVDARAAKTQAARLREGAFTTEHRKDGGLVSMRAADIELELIRLLRAYLADRQFVRPSDAGESWKTAEWAPGGRYTGVYTQDDVGFVREKLEVLHEVAAGEVDPSSRDFDGAHRTYFIVAADQWPRSVIVDEKTSRTHAGSLRIDSKLTAAWSRVEPELPDGKFDDFEPVGSRLDNASSSRLAAFQKRWDKERAEGVTLEYLLDPDALAAMSESDRARALMKLTSLLRHRPELVNSLTPELVAGLDTPTAVFAVAGLTGVQSEDAMDQVGEIIGQVEAGELERRRGMAMAAALGRPATDKSIRGLKELVESDSGETVSYGLLALGAQARDIESRDETVASEVRDDLLARLRAADTDAEIATLLRALGNAADPRLVEVATTYASHPSGIVRGAMVQALRFISSPSADVFIRDALLNDSDPSVRQRALMAIAHRDTNAAADTLRAVLRNDISEPVRVLALRQIGRNGLSDADRETLVFVSAEDPSERVRRLASAKLAEAAD